MSGSGKNLKEALLETARRLLVAEGYRNFSLRKVARQTGVSATSIYLHFENKDDLIHALMEQSIEDLNSRLQHVVELHADPVARLEAFASAYVHFAMQHPREYQIIYLVSSNEMARYPKEKFRKARKGYELLTAAIQQAAEQNMLEETYPRTAAYILWAQLHGVMSVVLSKRLDTRIDQQEFIEQAIAHILHGFHVRTALQPQKE